jgi:CheY-like chemotaxis protein
MVSHELRTPLSAILGWSHILSDPRRNSEMESKASAIIERNAKAQGQLIDDLLDMSRITTGKLRLEFQPIELTSIIKEALDVVRPMASAKAIDLRHQFDTKAAEVTGDADRLQQVVVNLLSNAIKFTSPGGWVEVRLERRDPDMQIIVSDNGRGIKTEFLPFLFDRFVQADVATTRRYSGLGLGLTIVRHLVELHGGTARAESKGEGQGAKFIVRLPIRAVRSTANESETERLPGTSRDFDAPLRLKGVRALVVDDQADARELLAAVLEQCGVQVTLAASAAEALALLIDAEGKEERPDVLISDIAMPGEDGYTLIHKVRDLGPEHGGNVPAIALTAYTRAEDRRRALAAGFQAHIGKPVDSQELKTAIAGLIGRLSA